MTQYDAGPGEWSDREWESPEHKKRPHAKRRRFTLPPWALLAILVAIVIILCVSLVWVVRAITGKGEAKTPTPGITSQATSTVALAPTKTQAPMAPTEAITPTPTLDLVVGATDEPSSFSEIAPGATVIVKGTLGAGLNLRAEPSRQGRLVSNAKEGAVFTVLEGPQEGGGYKWWKVRTSDGKEAWAAANWLVLKTE